MRDPKRIKPFLEKFEELWSLSPDLRFGQLVYSLKSGDMFNVEDNEWLEEMEKQINDWRKYQCY